MSARDDELTTRYREASAQDDARPGAHVRAAVRAHAQMLAAAAAQAPAVPAPAQPAANQSYWKISALATVAVVCLTGLLMLQFQRGTPEEQEIAYGQGRTGAAPARSTPPQASSAPAPQEVAREAPAAVAASPGTPAMPPAAPGGARDDATTPPSTRPAQAHKPAASPPPSPSPSAPSRPLARSAPAPVQESEAPAAPITSGAVSAFPASPPQAADQAFGQAPAGQSPNPAEPRAELRERSAAQSAPAAKAMPAPPAAAAPAAPGDAARAQAVPAPQATRNLSEGLAEARSGAAASARRADTANSGGTGAALPYRLHEAARTGRTQEMADLLAQGLPIDARDRAGRTALMLAAINGHAGAVQKLLALGANPALLDRDGQNAAQQARELGHARIAEMIEAAAR